MVKRIGALLLSPKTEWPVIAGESSGIGSLYAGYVAPLAAIAPLCKLVGWSLLFSYVGFGVALYGALLAYVLSLIGVGVLGLVACKLAPLFEGEADLVRATKLVAYSATAGWLGGVFRLIPGLAVISLFASLYSIYLLYAGAAPMMSVPQDRAIGYTVAVVVAALGVFVVIALLITASVGVKLLGMA